MKKLQKGVVFLPIIIIVVLLLVVGFFVYQNYQLQNKQPVVPPQPYPLETKPISTSSPVPTKYQDSLTPTKIPPMEINYSLPPGWETIKDSGNQFEIGFNPDEFKASSYPSRIGLNRNQCCFSFDIRIEPYDGGSRHSFLNQHVQGYESTPNTYEKNYQLNGGSGLVIYNMEFSSTIVIGMIDIDGNTAFFFSSTGGNQQQIEQILSTIKFL